MEKDILQTKENDNLCSKVIFIENEDMNMENGCHSACPTCITRSCILTQGHYSHHQCSEGHTWL